ncbi:MAG: 4Fe-4S dicluster domain-containing protein [Actinobacteria bacterium]|nr:4Fe-4S dicluster domain-containing protein [Actinomycetota bacterium]
MSEIERLFSIKNTMGYSINTFVDFDDPVDILCHLLISSEGTLGFIASAVLRSVPIPGFTSTALAVLPSLATASDALQDLTATRCRAIELMDARAIRVASQATDASELLPALDLGSEAVLLFEIAGESPEELRSNVADVESVIARSRATRFLVAPDTASENRIWRARKGLYALVALARPQGTSALLEDVAVPMHRLAQTCSGLSNLLEEFHYRDSVMFGHARYGNLHFLLSENFASSSGLDRYARFTERLVDLVLDNRGTLKAEHGTGRVMAPYLERKYGPELLSVMVEVKRLIDPHGILNPDVIISQDPLIHLKDLKTMPPVEEVVDRCVDCGFCEPVCPSRKFTTTPRQRMAIRRAMSLARESGNTELLDSLGVESSLEVVDSCAVDGMCSTVCPLGINTGTLVEQLRQERNSRAEQRLGVWGADHWGLNAALVSFGITVSRRIPRLTSRLATKARLVTSSSKIPRVDEDLPRGGHPRRPVRADNPEIIYLPSCMNTLFSAPENSMGVSRSFLALCREAGISVRIPTGIDELCCGTPWKPKGLDRGYRRMRESVRSTVVRETREGEIPLVTDASSCTEGFIKSLEGLDLPSASNIRVFDVVSFTVYELMPRLPKVERKFDSLALHPTCLIIRLGLEQDLKELTSEVAHRTMIPNAWGCCAFAGDRGLLVPGLTRAATEDQAHEVKEAKSAIHASCNRTCEIGMSRATGEPYSHILEYLAQALGIEVDNYREGARS